MPVAMLDLLPMTAPLEQLERHLYRRMRSTCEQYDLLEKGDRILVALSGGKDSYTMLELLGKLTARLPFEVELIAVHLDQRQPGYDGRPLERWLEGSGHRYEILSEDTYSVVVDKLEPGATYCSLCSRLRRGILYSAAERLGCNKLALGHHRDDALETFLMNMIYSGKLQAMPAAYMTDDGKFSVIRPLIECAESTIREYAALRAFPILPCNLCGSQPNLKRDTMTALLDSLEQQTPDVRSVMFAALKNVVPTHLLDRDVLAAWSARPETVAPKPITPRATPRTAALPVMLDHKRLPLIGA
jgi:tRNA 2-thiocytidine biosynthesis protein TtcA